MNPRIAAIFSAAVLLLAATTAHGLEFRIGATLASLSTSDEHGAAQTVLPTAEIGFGLTRDVLILAQASQLSYSVEKKGDRTNKTLSEGTVDIKGTSLAAILEKRFAPVNLRLGYGVVQYQYDNKLSALLLDELASLGIANAKEELKPAEGSQILLGVDFNLARFLLAGIEYRSVSVKPKVAVSYDFLGQHLTATDKADLSHTWLAFRVLLAF